MDGVVTASLALLSASILTAVYSFVYAARKARRTSPEQRTATAAAFEADTKRIVADTERLASVYARLDAAEATIRDLVASKARQAAELLTLRGQVTDLEGQVIGLGATPVTHPA